MAKKLITPSDLDSITVNSDTNKVEVGQTTNALVEARRPDKLDTTQSKHIPFSVTIGDVNGS